MGELNFVNALGSRLSRMSRHQQTTPSRPPGLLPLFVLIAALVVAPPAQAEGNTCHYICAPELIALPSADLQNLFSQGKVRSLVTGRERELDASAGFGTIFNLQAHTEIPRISLLSRVLIVPYSGSSSVTSDLTIPPIDGNSPMVEYGFALDLLTAKETKDWLTFQLNILGIFMPSYKSGTAQTYSNQFAPDLLATVHIFHWLPQDNWFRNVTFYSLLKYQATGVPQAGDVTGNLLWLKGASPWDLWVGIGIPIAPLFPH